MERVLSIDSILLGEFVYTKRNERIIDLGTGCGIIPLMIYDSAKNNNIYAVEIQEKLADISKRSVILNNLEKEINNLQDDMQNLLNRFPSVFFDVITSNPSYIPAGKGKVSS